MKKIAIPLALLLSLLLLPAPVFAQSVVLDGTAGNNTIDTNYTATGDLDLSLGFFADYLLVGGGGGGGVRHGGGGGAGGMLDGTLQLGAANYTITVGAGGSGATKPGGTLNPSRGASGGNSTFASLVAIGGGGGGSFSDNSADTRNGLGGGSGGGAASGNPVGTPGSGTAGQGNNGGTIVSFSNFPGSGGGGASAAGGNISSAGGSNGGAGRASSITGTSITYAGGGGGAGLTSAGAGGAGGGGAGATGDNIGGSGTNGLGGGGGGARSENAASSTAAGGNGGSGVVIVRYQGASLGNIGGTVTSGTGTAAGYTIHTFTTTGASGFDMSGVDLNQRLGANMTGQISGSGNLVFKGPGNLTLGAANSHSGTTRAESGTLRIGHVNALSDSTLDMNAADTGTVSLTLSGQTYNIGGLQGSRNLVLGNNNISVGSNNASTSYSGDLSGTGRLIKTGSGNLVLGGANSYSGGTTVSAGRLLGDTSSLQGRIFNDSVVEFNQATAGTYSGTLDGAGSMVKTGAGTLTISGVLTPLGGTTISEGRLKASTSSLYRNVTNNAELEFSQGSNGSTAVTIGGTGSLIKTGAGTITLTGTNTYSGGSTISEGRLRGTTQSIQGNIANNSALELLTYSNSAFSGNITGSGSVIVTSFGSSLTLTGTNSYGGGTQISYGRLIGDTSSLQGNITVTSGHVEFNQSGAGTYAGTINGTSSTIHKTGSGIVTMSGSNSFSQLRITEGTLALGSTDALGNSGTIIMNGGTLRFTASNTQDYSSRLSNSGSQNFSIDTNGQDVTFASAIAGGNSMLTKLGVGTLTLTGNNTYYSGTTVSEGRLVGNSASLRYAITNNSELEFNQTTAGTYSGNLSGTGSFTKSGSGTLTLSGSNSLSGGVSLDAGALSVASANALGNSGTIFFGGGTLQYGATNPVDYSARFSTAAGQQYSIDTNGWSVALASALTSSGGSLSKLGNGTLTLSASNTYGGGTTITRGTLATSGNERLANTGAVTIESAGRLAIGGNETIAQLSGSGSTRIEGRLSTGSTSSTYSGSFTGAGGLTKTGAGTFTLTGTSTNTGDTIVSNGTLVLSNANALWSGGVVNLQSGGTLTLNQRTFVGAIDQSGGTINGPGELVATLTATSSGALDSAIADGPDYAAGILKRTSGTTTIGAANTFTGVINVQGGTLQLGTGGFFSSASSLVTSTGATMDLNNKSQTFSSLGGSGGTVALGTGNLTVNQSGTGEYGGFITGSGGVVKSGSGTTTLTGGNTYLGSTTVSAGTLNVSGSLASTATVQSGASLGGSGSIGGLIIDSGGSVKPGNSPGTLTVTGNALWNAGGNYDWESLATNTDPAVQTAAGTNWDFIDITGTLTFGGLGVGNEFNLNLSSFSSPTTPGAIPDWDPAVGSTWLVARAAGGIYNNSTLLSANTNYSNLFNINTTGWLGDLPLGGFQVVTLGSANDLYLQAVGSAAVPEPGQVAASLLLLAAIGGYAWMKRRKSTDTVASSTN